VLLPRRPPPHLTPTAAGKSEVAAQMRHEYMEQLMYRAEQQRLLTTVVQENTKILKREHQVRGLHI
jgi:hypothetical protein